MQTNIHSDATKLPRHIAIIMDGNGRWAKKRLLPRAAGHRAGVEALRAVITHCDELGIEALTVYAFSTENWARSREEVGALMALLLEYFTREIDELNRKNVRILILGDVDGLPEKQRDAVRAAMQRTRANTGLKLNIALNYGARAELARAARNLAARAAAGEIDPRAIDESALERELYTAGLPEVDLLIRTSGEQRLSNFLLYQLAYAEFVFDPVLWPDYDAAALDRDIAEFSRRQRRFGGR
ncbi:MAG TPA: isoprenyl transferase [Candidatus Fimadaptatus faecigallinarum]|uniref:Isoprenyl transferase n=1 Tax=Candidatus Fimadaptatus faecigallinarum TaxID=2840814 RepID=A0A9D1S4Q2_9FIRM|nr:isoprenyl transferase [Candidatus Fimadaptatus faecigallinarum]